MSKINRPIQIKTLPRAGEKPEETPALVAVQKPPQSQQEPSGFRLNPTQVILISIVALSAFVLFWPDRESVSIGRTQSGSQTSDDTPEMQVNQFQAEAQVKQRMAEQTRELENRQLAKPLNGTEEIIPESKRPLGVTLDQEGSAERVYKDIYGSDNKNKNPQTPEERISKKLEERQWMNQLEKQERKQYVESFLREAYDAGYAIDLDENLVVVRVRKITSKPSQTLDQVLDGLTRKGY